MYFENNPTFWSEGNMTLGLLEKGQFPLGVVPEFLSGQNAQYLGFQSYGSSICLCMCSPIRSNNAQFGSAFT